MKTEQTRYHFVDGIRGIAIINMVVFHLLYDVYVIYGKNPAWYSLPVIHLWQQAICQTFIFVSGFAWQWGIKGNVRRGLRFHAYGFLITAVTGAAIPSETIWFGILNFMGSAVLFMFPIHKAAKKISPVLGLGICMFLFIFCRQMQYGYLGFEKWVQFQIPEAFYSVKVLTPLGFPFPEFHSSDYFPVFPWMFLYMCGYFSNEILMEHRFWRCMACYKIPIVSVIGSRTIWFYLLHQPVCMLICSLIF